MKTICELATMECYYHNVAKFKEEDAAASEDTALLASAQQRAQILLEEYVNNIGNKVEKEYSIEWKYIEDNDQDSVNTTEESTGTEEVKESE